MAEKKENRPEQEQESFLDKAKEWADKAEDFFEDISDKFKKSDAFKKAEEFLDKADDYIENKVDDFEKSGMKDKLQAFADKMEDKTEDFLDKAGVKGKELADKANSLIEKYKKKMKEKDKPEEDSGEELKA